MREIKYRAWTKSDGMVKVSQVNFDKQTVYWWIRNDSIEAKVDSVEIMQYTGLKDRLGKEIWEGDIIKHYMGDSLQTNPSVVKWNSDGGWSPWLEFEGDSYTRVSKAEVIGNIHENPELLKES